MDRNAKLAQLNDWAELEELERLFSGNWGPQSMEPFHEIMVDYDLFDGPLAYWYWCDQLDKLPSSEENDDYPSEEDVRRMLDDAAQRGSVSAQELVAWFNAKVAFLIESPQRQVGLFQLLAESTDVSELQGKDKEWMEEIKDKVQDIRRQLHDRKRRTENE